LRDQCVQVRDALASFRDKFRKALAPTTLEALDSFIDDLGKLLADNSSSSDTREELLQASLLKLGAFEGQMTFLLADVQELIRSRADRAFEHLQRSIVADPDFRAKWQAAYGDGERACEQLGAVHLLLHGIWAFKVDAAGERTDLVYQEPIVDFDTVLQTADGLVLTEWKKAAKSSDAKHCFEDARRQAKRYAKGSLAGIELTRYRYAVVVSKNHVDVPANVHEDGIEYRHVNIAVDPKTPSRKS
jgi:hypothetical protein